MENKTRDIDFYRKNADEDFATTPISVLRYISELEAQLKECKTEALFGRSDNRLRTIADIVDKALESSPIEQPSPIQKAVMSEDYYEPEAPQQEFWKDIYLEFEDGEGWINFTKRMSEKYTITRKPL